MNKYIGCYELAKMLGVSTTTPYNWARTKKFPYLEILGKICFDKEMVDKIVASKDKILHSKPKWYKKKCQ